MKALDTNALARFFVDDADDALAAKQRPAAVAALAERSFVSVTVLPELEWVMCGFYGPTNRLRSASLAILLTAVGVSASAGVITTTFVAGNSFAGNMLNLQVGSSSLLLTGIDVNLSNARSTGNLISLYTRSGSYAGFENNAAGWTLRDSVSVTSAGADNATFVNLSDFILDAADLYGVYVTLSSYGSNATSMLYTNGNNSYANTDLTLTLGIGKGSPDFTGGTFNPRTWNGSIYYDVVSTNVPEPGSLALVGLALLAGLGLSQRARRQRAA